MTRRGFLVVLGLQRPPLQRLSREPENAVAEVPRPEGFILRGPLTNATSDGSASYAVGDHAIAFHPGCALRPGMDALVGQRVVMEVRRDA